MFQIETTTPAAIAQVGSIVTSSALITFGLEAMKRSKYFPWLSQKSASVNHVVAAILSLFASWGVHTHYDSIAHTYTITGICAVCIGHGLYDWAKSYVTTRLIYEGIVQRASTSAFVNVTKDKVVAGSTTEGK